MDLNFILQTAQSFGFSFNCSAIGDVQKVEAKKDGYEFIIEKVGDLYMLRAGNPNYELGYGVMCKAEDINNHLVKAIEHIGA